MIGKTSLMAAVSALALAGCTYNNGTPNDQATGALVGGLTGAAVGNAVGGDTQGAVIGGLIGAAVGGAIGAQMANQERELRQSLAGSGADIVNSGSQLVVILPEAVSFPTASASVNAGFLPTLSRIAESLKQHPSSTIRVVGHTDNVGSWTYNLQLSRDRALAVANILIADRVSASRITFSGRSYAEPITSNATALGRAQNRRVEIIITPTN